MKVKTMNQQDVADNLLWPLWRCLSDDYKDRYKRDVWEHFENAVKSAAYTGKLKTYLSNFKNRLPIELQAQYGKEIQSVIDSGQDYEILNWLRDEATYLVMIVRLRNQERKESFKA